MGYFDKQEIINISIHSPHARGDEGGETMFGNATVFQSTPLTRGETCKARHALRDRRISIHSPHARGDAARGLDSEIIKISIHSPHARGDFHRLRGHLLG